MRTKTSWTEAGIETERGREKEEKGKMEQEDVSLRSASRAERAKKRTVLIAHILRLNHNISARGEDGGKLRRLSIPSSGEQTRDQQASEQACTHPLPQHSWIRGPRGGHRWRESRRGERRVVGSTVRVGRESSAVCVRARERASSSEVETRVGDGKRDARHSFPHSLTRSLTHW